MRDDYRNNNFILFMWILKLYGLEQWAIAY